MWMAAFQPWPALLLDMHHIISISCALLIAGFPGGNYAAEVWLALHTSSASLAGLVVSPSVCNILCCFDL